MRKEFIYNLLLVIGANLLIKPIYIFGIDRTVQNIVGPEDYGLYFALFNFALLFQVITDIGLQNFNNRSISQESTLTRSYLPAILLIKTGLAIIFLILLFGVAFLLGYEEASLQLLLWIATNTILVSLILYLRTNISGLGKYRLDSFLSVLDKSLMIAIIGFMIWQKENLDIMDFVQGQTLALGITTLVVFILVIRMVTPLEWPKSIVFPMNLLKKSAPYALVVLLMTIYTRIDGVMIERMLVDGQMEAGIYASGYRFFDAANMLGFLAAGLLLPMFSKLFAQNEPMFPLYKVGIHAAWIIAIFLATTCYIFRVELVDLLYIHATDYWGEVLGVLMLSFVFVMLGYVTGPLLNANGSIWKLNWIFLISIAINIGLNLMLITRFKAYGAALATLFTQAFVVLVQILYVNRTANFSFVAYPVRQMIFFALLTILVVVALKSWASNGWQIILGVFVYGVVTLLYLGAIFRSVIKNEHLTLGQD